MLPANAENTAPKIKAITINILVDSTTWDTIANKTLETKTNMVSNLYSAFKNAKAPS